MTGGGNPGPGPVRPIVALPFAAIGYIALVIAGLGMTSLATGEDVIQTPGLGQLPGGSGVVLSAAAFAGMLWLALTAVRPSFWGALWTTAAAFLAYLAGVGLGALIAGADPAVAAGIAGRLALSWFGVVVAAAALVASWAGIALVRTRTGRPHWPWEGDDE